MQNGEELPAASHCITPSAEFLGLWANPSYNSGQSAVKGD
jgi:hypothetical protein